MNILDLVVSEPPFEVMVTGEKKEEFRRPSNWIKSRLFNKDGSKRDYDFIRISHAYAPNRPTFICEFKGFETLTKPEKHIYSNGLKVNPEPGYFKIFCGSIIPWTNNKLNN